MGIDENKSVKKEANSSQEKSGDAKKSCLIVDGCCGKKMCDYISKNKSQSLIYAFLALGFFLFLFSEPWFGGLILGSVIGYYFSSDIVFYLRNLGHIFSGEEKMRHAILAVLIISLIIAAPGIFIGAIVVAALRQVIWS